ncbi:MAG: RNA-directed DNA polymerase, partial [Tepidisphaeraceae bacterium]
PEVGEKILKCLTEVLIGLGLKLSSTKTTGSLPVVSSALKVDKRAWLRSRQGDRNIQKHLLVIHSHGAEFPNAGSLTLALTKFHQRLHKQMSVKNPTVLISIAADISYTSPRVFPICAAIISELLGRLKDKKTRVEAIKKVYRKLSQLPNTGHMEIWLQRISHTYEPKLAYTENLCQIVREKPAIIWNNDWITSNALKKAIDEKTIVNKAKLKSLKPIIKPAEIAVFNWIGLFDS